MTTQEINRKLHQLLGKCQHQWNMEAGYCTVCFDNVHSVRVPDYCGNPRLVIDVMRGRNNFGDFIEYVGGAGDNLSGPELIPVDLIMDRAGKLALLALEWLGKEKMP